MTSTQVSWIAVGLALVSGTRFQEQSPQDGGKAKPRNLVSLPADYVRFLRVPEQGIQPRLEIGAEGALHVLSFRGQGEAGDLQLCRSTDEGQSFSSSVRVNSREQGVAAPDGVHGGALALGPEGRAHVLWIGSEAEHPLLYSRSKSDGAGFEPERSLLASPARLGRGPAVAVDSSSHVYVVYAAEDPATPGDTPAEPHVRIFMLRSADGGASFSEPLAIDKEKHGVSIDSALSAHADRHDTLCVLYRSAMEPRNPDNKAKARDTRLMVSEDGGETFDTSLAGNWKAQRDPCSRSCFFPGPNRMLAAWEAGNQVFWAHINRETRKVALPLEPRRGSEEYLRTFPALCTDKGSEVFLAWLQRPGGSPEAEPSIAWQVWDKGSNAPLGNGLAPESAGKSSPVVLPRAAGGFTVIY